MRSESKAVLALLVVTALALMLIPTRLAAAVTSPFTTDADGWTRAPGGDSGTTVTYTASGGNPGGAIVLTDAAQGSTDYFLAPAKFLGDDSSAYGGTFSYDMMDTLGDSGGTNTILLTGSGITLAYDPGPFAANTWFHATAVMTEFNGWGINQPSGVPPTHTQFMNVLSNVTSLEILGDFTAGSDVTTLDNVNLPTLPEPAIGVAGAALLFVGPRRRK